MTLELVPLCTMDVSLADTITGYAAPLFHIGDERYQWLNRIQAVSKGHFPGPNHLIYEVYELR